MLREALVSMGNDVHLLDKWYRKDSNKVNDISSCQICHGDMHYVYLHTATNCSNHIQISCLYIG